MGCNEHVIENFQSPKFSFSRILLKLIDLNFRLSFKLIDPIPDFNLGYWNNRLYFNICLGYQSGLIGKVNIIEEFTHAYKNNKEIDMDLLRNGLKKPMILIPVVRRHYMFLIQWIVFYTPGKMPSGL